MKKINILYWVFNILLIPTFGIGSVVALFGSPAQEELLAQLGYPSYFLVLISISKILALLAIFFLKNSRIKEWAYAGLTFDVIAAIYSLLATFGDPTMIIIPILALCFVWGSYYCHHKRTQIYIWNV